MYFQLLLFTISSLITLFTLSIGFPLIFFGAAISEQYYKDVVILNSFIAFLIKFLKQIVLQEEIKELLLRCDGYSPSTMKELLDRGYSPSHLAAALKYWYSPKVLAVVLTMEFFPPQIAEILKEDYDLII